MEISKFFANCIILKILIILLLFVLSFEDNHYFTIIDCINAIIDAFTK